jgi:hypothetical protein
MRRLFRWPATSGEGAAAIVRAQRSYDRAVTQRDAMADLRAEAHELETQVRAHNTANRYDDWLKQVIQGGRE